MKEFDIDIFTPYDVAGYVGRIFQTKSGLLGVTQDYRLKTHPMRMSVQDAKIYLIAGIGEEELEILRVAGRQFRVEDNLLYRKKEVDDLIERFGEKPVRGLHLIISYTDKEAVVRQSNGIVTPPIQDIRAGTR
ncbi:hypothetical protein ACFL0V_05570 [Nanoarchaeota archaeon]